MSLNVVQYKGVCGKCGEAVLSDQERSKDAAGQYFHIDCAAAKQPGLAQGPPAASAAWSGLDVVILSSALEAITGEGEAQGKSRDDIVTELQQFGMKMSKDVNGINTLYVGDADAQNKPHGQGVQVWLPECSYYSGSFMHGLRKGKGMHLYRDTSRSGCIYNGDFEVFGASSKFHGQCTATLLDGSIFWGSVLENCPVEGNLQKDGQVHHVWYDGKTYIFSKDLQSIKKEFISPLNGCGRGSCWFKGELCTYEGSWANGAPDGEGTMTWPEGSTYVGTWVNGYRKGYGTQSYKQVSRCKWERGTYRGEWEVFDGSSYYHGRGTATFPNGTVLKDAMFRRCCPISGTLVEPGRTPRHVTFQEMIYMWNPVLLSKLAQVDRGQSLEKDMSGMGLDAAVIGQGVVEGLVDVGLEVAGVAASEEAVAIYQWSAHLMKDVSVEGSGVGKAIDFAFKLTSGSASGIPIIGGVLQVFAGIKMMVETHLRTQELGKRLLIWITSVVAMLNDLQRKIQQLQGHLGDRVAAKTDRCISLAMTYHRILDGEFRKKKTFMGKMMKQVKGLITASSLEERLRKIQTQMDHAVSELMLELINSMLDLHIVTIDQARKMTGSITTLMDRMKIVVDMQKKLWDAYDLVKKRLDDHEVRINEIEAKLLRNGEKIIAPRVDDIIVDLEARGFWIRHFGGSMAVVKSLLADRLIPEYRLIPSNEIVRASDMMDNDRDGMVTAWEFNDFTMYGGLCCGITKLNQSPVVKKYSVVYM